MSVLDCLAKASSSVVTRQEIFDRVWRGAIVSDEALTQRIAEIRKAFGDSAHESNIVETIPKIGFRLIPPVTPLPGEAEAGAANPVIAVLPFVNLSEDAANEYFSDGISGEVINLLSKVPALDVISQTSSFSFKGQSWKVADLARELSASLIVEGTVRIVEKQVRITAQLIDPGTDRHLWSDSYDLELSDIFSLQEDIAQSIVTALQDEIGTHTVVASRPTGNIEAYELFLSGRRYFYQRGAAMDKAIRVLKMAVEEDPEFAEAWAYLAAAACVAWVYQTSISDEESILLADQAARTSLDLDPGMGLALAVQAMLAYGYEGDVKKGFQLIDIAADEYPHDTTTRLWAGMFTHHWGYLEEALHHFQYACRHNPRAGITNGMLGQVYLEEGREEFAAPHLVKATELGWPLHVFTKASRHMMRGELDAAFAYLKVVYADPGTDSDPLPWIHELEEAGRSYIEYPASIDALIAVLERAPEMGVWGKLYLTLFFDLRDQFFEHFSHVVRDNHLWTMIMMIVWLPEYRAYVEDPRFLEIMHGDGALELWENRGFPDGCIRVNDSAGDRLDCSMRYQEILSL
jgi:TolB-like protein/Tfp pilus assembly protein PilF